MNSKEALEKLSNVCVEIKNIKSDISYFTTLKEMYSNEFEILEKELFIVKDVKPFDIFQQSLERLEKYKEAIEIIDNALEIYVVDDKLGVKYQSLYIHHEDSKLVEEVLKNG